MYAFISGASGGIGYEIAKQLSEKGYDLVVCARRTDRLEQLKKEVSGKCEIITADLSKKEDVDALLEQLDRYTFSLAVNNAGCGLYGDFCSTEEQRELFMIQLNICALHRLTKYFAKRYCNTTNFRILNVASSAAFLPGPYMATYYATKAYVLRLSLAVNEELRQNGKKRMISVLCPGPVDTEFNQVAQVTFGLRGLSAEKVAKLAVAKTLAGREIIIPGTAMKAACFFERFLPNQLLVRCAAYFQKKKEER